MEYLLHDYIDMSVSFFRRLAIPAAVLATITIDAVAQPFSDLRLRDVYVIPFSQRFDNTQVGGLSGIDYDASNDTYYLISDDRSALQPARYYQAQIRISERGIDTVVFTRKVDLIGPDGRKYPSIRESPRQTVDPEGLRRNSATGELVWLSEGERIVKASDTLLVNPAIIVTQDGRYLEEYQLPANMRMSKNMLGPRQNGSLEALTFSEAGKTLWVALEEPLYEDGPRADVEESPALVRFYQFDALAKKSNVQFAYDLDPVAHSPILNTAFRVNGITDILDAGSGQLLAVERSFSTGRLSCTIKIYLTGFESAQDVSKVNSLKGAKVPVASKRLLLNMDTLGIHVDNVEGITWGPLLPNGSRSLILVTDNNFQEFQKTQIFLFEVIGN